MNLSLIWDLIFPAHCLGCNKFLPGGRVVCEDCLNRIPLNSTLFCGRCRARLARNRRECHPKHPYLLGAAGDYRHPLLQQLIALLKFKGRSQAAQPLARLLIQYSEHLPIRRGPVMVMPIPLGPRRERQRGFNQAQLLAAEFSKHFGLPLANNLLYRRRNTPPQSGIKSYPERRANLAGSFAVREPKSVAGKSIILIDDVTTSGETFLAAAATLKLAGARKIIALAVAKA